jgi:hypothetical protein
MFKVKFWHGTFEYVLNSKLPGEYVIAVTKSGETYPLLQYIIE